MNERFDLIKFVPIEKVSPGFLCWHRRESERARPNSKQGKIPTHTHDVCLVLIFFLFCFRFWLWRQLVQQRSTHFVSKQSVIIIIYSDAHTQTHVRSTYTTRWNDFAFIAAKRLSVCVRVCACAECELLCRFIRYTSQNAHAEAVRLLLL